MIFPIQPPLTERDDKAAALIIAVVYGMPPMRSPMRSPRAHRERASLEPPLPCLVPRRRGFYLSRVSILPHRR